MKTCSRNHGSGTQTCNATGSEWGTCGDISSCDSGYNLQDGNCVVNACTPNAKRSCNLANGTGSQTCNASGSAWGNCGNPNYEIDPKVLFPTAQSLLPEGTVYSDSVPDTLDLAERASWFIQGAVQTVTPSLHYAPAGMVLTEYMKDIYDCTEGGQFPLNLPCLFRSPQNWGKVMQALSFAREMSPYDRDDLFYSLTSQHRMMTNMLDYDVSLDLLNKAMGSIVIGGTGCGFGCITSSSVAMQALATERSRTKASGLEHAVNEFVRMHKNSLLSTVDSAGKSYKYFAFPAPTLESYQGYLGDSWRPFVNGKALRVLSDWYTQTGNSEALEIANALSEYIRNFEASVMWRSPDARFVDAYGYVYGHIHSWLQATLGLVAHAEALRKASPDSSLAKSELELALKVYNFVKAQTRAGKIGNFGEAGSTGDMVLLAIKLTEQGMGYFYEDAEAWTRNALAEMQIDAGAASYISNYSRSHYEHSFVGAKVKGMFFGDGTHVLSIPKEFAGGTSDYSPNAFAGMHEVWKKTVTYKGNFAQINFLLNRASTYLDVKSDLPYRGQIRIQTKASLGPITDFGLRIPDWADKDKVTVSAVDPQGREYSLPAWQWNWIPYTYYIQVNNLASNWTFIVRFPIKVYSETIYELRSMSQIWYEGSWATSQSVENLQSYVGQFRGNTLVGVDRRPAGGIPRYQRQTLESLPASDVAPPMRTLQRLIVKGN
ncbi:MAG: hypothetical protein AB7P49_07415 [Bdellovibrionales bacterium]